MRLVSTLGASGLVFCASASVSLGQQPACVEAPTITVYQVPGAKDATASVTSHIRLSEDAYIFVVERDLDGQLQVLHPDSAGTPIRTSAHKPAPLPSFFAGFGRSRGGSGGPRYHGSYGTLMALASCAPFKLDLISSHSDWNIDAIRNLIDGRSPQMAMDALARYLGAKGAPIGRDYMWFTANGYHFAQISQPYAW